MNMNITYNGLSAKPFYTLCPNKKGATDFFALTFTNINRFS